MEKKYGIKTYGGAVIPLTIDEYHAILPRISRGEGMLTVGDRTVAVKAIAEILPLIEIDKWHLKDRKKWRCQHGTIYENWEKCTCDLRSQGYTKVMIGGGEQNQGVLDNIQEYISKRLNNKEEKKKVIKKLKGLDKEQRS